MEVQKKLTSKDNSVKYLLALSDNEAVEALYMCDMESKLTFHSTLCVSSQVGCSMGCKFCATGAGGFVRNLTAHEIFQQAALCNADCTKEGRLPLDAVVFAGMGEPLLNYENVKAAIHGINTEYGIRNFEIATVGVIPGIYRMIEDFKDSPVRIRLNLSLHASEDKQRKKIIPSANQHDIKSLVEAAADYARVFQTRGRVRYALFKGFNDSDEDVERLCNLLENKPLKLIVSQYNDNQIPGLAAPEMNEVEEFCRKAGQRIDCGVFYNFGSDIKGGCGQLRQVHRV